MGGDTATAAAASGPEVGVVFPQTEIGADPGAVRHHAQAVEDLGFSHLVAYDHVVGADPAAHPGWRGPYTHRELFHEPLVLFGYLAGATRRIGLATGIVILPQRQAVLAAKQAAEVDVLSAGRLRLGVAVGWNEVEYGALGADFRRRGRILDEQIALLRALWTEPVVDFAGRFHRVRGAGLNPLPVQRPIPVWVGGHSDAALSRAARLGDGWMPARRLDDAIRAAVDRLRALAAAAGRDPAGLGLEGRITLAGLGEDAWASDLAGWRAVGATHVSVNTMGMGLRGAEAHVAALRRVAEVLAPAG